MNLQTSVSDTSKRNLIYERAEYFVGLVQLNPKRRKTVNSRKNDNSNQFPTLRDDSISTKSSTLESKKNNINNTNNNISTNVKEDKIEKEHELDPIQNSNNNMQDEKNINLEKNEKNLSYNLLELKESSEIFQKNDENNPLTASRLLRNSIKINKNLVKYAEPVLKMKMTKRLSKKFDSIPATEHLKLDINLPNDHDLINLDREILEIDEKISQSKFDFIEAKRTFVMQPTFDFTILRKIDDIYDELINQIKEFGLDKQNNIYKEKMGAAYYEIFIKESNNISDLFEYNKDINKFLYEELIFYIFIMNIRDFEDLTENELIGIKSIISYLHINFLFVVKMIINNYQNVKNKDEINYSKCLEILDKYPQIVSTFNSNKTNTQFCNKNKVIKEILNDLISNLNETKNGSLALIKDIFFNRKKIKFSRAKNNIKKNVLLTQKFKSILDYYKIKDCLTDDANIFTIKVVPKPPFLPQKKEGDNREYTLVLDLDETLVHFIEEEDSAYVQVRANAENFIERLSDYCEVIIFTAATKEYADSVINELSCKDKIDYRLYREHTNFYSDVTVKDISKLGRDLKKIIFIDNAEENFQLQPKNGLGIKSFEGDAYDNELSYLLNDLLPIVNTKDLDVREHLDGVRNKMKARYS